MKIVNANPLFNPNNNGFLYLCAADDGTVWVRSSAGKWTQIDSPLDFDSISADFDSFIARGVSATLDDVLKDNISTTVVPVSLYTASVETDSVPVDKPIGIVPQP